VVRVLAVAGSAGRSTSGTARGRPPPLPIIRAKRRPVAAPWSTPRRGTIAEKSKATRPLSRRALPTLPSGAICPGCRHEASFVASICRRAGCWGESLRSGKVDHFRSAEARSNTCSRRGRRRAVAGGGAGVWPTSSSRPNARSTPTAALRRPAPAAPHPGATPGHRCFDRRRFAAPHGADGRRDPRPPTAATPPLAQPNRRPCLIAASVPAPPDRLHSFGSTRGP
jgi:hypothetical protein